MGSQAIRARRPLQSASLHAGSAQTKPLKIGEYAAVTGEAEALPAQLAQNPAIGRRDEPGGAAPRRGFAASEGTNGIDNRRAAISSDSLPRTR
jgi:hypothetical protein